MNTRNLIENQALPPPPYVTESGNHDWVRAWDQRMSESGLSAKLGRNGISDEEFWGAYHRWQKVLRKSGYPDRIIKRVLPHIKPGYSVIDVGAGCGAYAIPIAQIASQVTAIEPSPKQLHRFEESLRGTQSDNIKIVPLRWEDVDIKDINRHDVLLAAYSLQMADISTAINKMCLATTKKVILIHTAGSDLVQTMEKLFSIQPAPDYRYLFNLLRQLNLAPEVEIIDRHYTVKLETQLDILSYNPGLSKKQCSLLTEYLRNNGQVEVKNSQSLLKRHQRDAVIVINTEEKGEGYG